MTNRATFSFSEKQNHSPIARMYFPRLVPVALITFNSDWFTELFASLVIGQSNCFVLVLGHSVQNHSICGGIKTNLQRHKLCSCLSPILLSSKPIQEEAAVWLEMEHLPHSVAKQRNKLD